MSKQTGQFLQPYDVVIQKNTDLDQLKFETFFRALSI